MKIPSKITAVLLFLIFCGKCDANIIQDDSVSVWLVKLGWHTGLVIPVEEIDSSYFREKNLFSRFTYIDVGWGDDEFYRTPGFDLGLALKALFYPTESTIRVEGFTFDIVKYVNYADVGYVIRMKKDEFNRLTHFVSKTFNVKEDNNVELLESRYGGHITFYRARGKYSFLNTCNTWVSRAFKSAGYDIRTKLVLAEELFTEIQGLSNAERVK